MDPRPRTMTPEIAEAAARATVDDLIKAGLIESERAADHIKDVAKHGETHMDGYQLAKTLEDRCWWECDLRMAEELDGFASHVDGLIEEAQKAWAARNDVKPPHPDGTRVKLRRGETGTIDGVYEHGVAQYRVKVDGDPQADGPHKARRIVYFEDVEPLDAEVPAT